MNDTQKIENIRQEILKEAKTKCDAQINAAKSWAENFEKTKISEIDGEISIGLKQNKKDSELKSRQLLLSSQLEQKNKKLKKEAELIDEVFEEASKKLDIIRKDPNYTEMIKAMVIEAVLKLKDDDLEVIIDVADEKVITKDFLSSIEIIFVFTYNRALKLDISEKKITTHGGILIKVKNKNLYINNTFEERLNSLKNEIKTEIIKELLA